MWDDVVNHSGLFIHAGVPMVWISTDRMLTQEWNPRMLPFRVIPSARRTATLTVGDLVVLDAEAPAAGNQCTATRIAAGFHRPSRHTRPAAGFVHGLLTQPAGYT